MNSKPYKQSFVAPWDDTGPAPIVRQGPAVGLPVEIDLQPRQVAQGAFAPARGAQQHDSGVTAAKGTVLRALPAIVITLPITFGLFGAAWLYGWLAFPGWAAYALTVATIWGCGSLLGYLAIVRADHAHSAGGVERRRIDAAENVMLEQIAAEERIRREVITTHRDLILTQYGANDGRKQIR